MREGWKYKPLKDVATFTRGLTYSKKDEDNTSSKVVLRSNNVDLSTGKLVFGDLKYLKESFDIPIDKVVKKGSLLMCMSNGSKSHLGKVALIDNDYPYAFGGFMGLVSPCNELNPKYFHLTLSTPIYKDFIKQLSAGANINNIKIKDLEKFEIPIPPLDEQQRIVEYLDSAFAKIDALKAKAKENLDNAQALFQAALNEMMTPKEGWEEKEFGKLCHFVRGPFGGYWWLHQDSLFYLLKLSDNQLLLNLCPFQKFSRGTKTGQNHRKINIRTLLTEDAFVVQSFQRCKDTNLSRKKTKVCPYFSHFQAIFFKVFSNRITQVDLIS